MNILCDLPCIQCGSGPIDPDNPFVNLSSEAPDADYFIGRQWSGGFPPLGQTWYANFCLGWCLSAVSQAEADLCALNAAVLCISTNWPLPNGNGGFMDRTIFYSSSQYCAFTCPDGTEFRFTTATGLFTSVANQETADLEAYSYACTKVVDNYVCMGDLSPSRGCLGESFSATAATVSPNAPLTFAVTDGALPDGIALLDGTVLILQGIPTVLGDFTFTITATDSQGNTMSKSYTISIVGISTTSPLPDATNGDAYSEVLVYVGTPVGTLVWSVESGTLPTGLTLNSSTGEISGTPTTDGSYSFTISATDGALACSKEFELVVAAVSLDFSSIVWSVINPGLPAFYEVIAPDSILNDFRVYCVNAGPANAESEGSLTYTGAAVVCNLHVSVTNYVVGADTNPSIPILIKVNAATVLSIDAWTDCAAVGDYDFPFVVPISVAASITVNAQANRVDIGFSQGQFDAVFTLTPST